MKDIVLLYDNCCIYEIVILNYFLKFTARANAYVDFAIEAAKALDLFEDEADLQETVSFWKEFKRVSS